MFLRAKWMKDRGRLQTPWEAAWKYDEEVCSDMDSISLPQLCNDLSEVIKSESKNLKHRIALRSSAHLLYGMHILLEKKTDKLYEDFKMFDESYKSTSTNSESIIESNMNHGLGSLGQYSQNICDQQHNSTDGNNEDIDDSFNEIEAVRNLKGRQDEGNEFSHSLVSMNSHNQSLYSSRKKSVYRSNANNSLFVNARQHTSILPYLPSSSISSIKDINSRNNSSIDIENNSLKDFSFQIPKQSFDFQSDSNKSHSNSDKSICSNSINLENDSSNTNNEIEDFLSRRISSQSSSIKRDNNTFAHSTPKKLHTISNNEECLNRKSIYIYYPKNKIYFNPKKLIVSKTKNLSNINNCETFPSNFVGNFGRSRNKINIDETQQNKNDVIILKTLNDFWKKKETISLSNLISKFPKSWLSHILLSLFSLKNHRYIVFIRRNNTIVNIIGGPAFARMISCAHSKTVL